MQAARPTEFWTLLAVTSSAMFAVLVLVAMHVPYDPVPLLVVLVAAVVFESSPVVVKEDSKLTLSVIVLFCAIAYGGMALAVTAGLATGVVSGLTSKTARWVKGTVNTAMSVIEAAAAAWIFSLVANVSLFPAAGRTSIDEPLLLTLGLLAAAAVSSIINALLLTAVLRSASGVPFAQTLRQIGGTIAGSQFVYVGLGAIAYVLLVSAGPASLLLLTIPLIVARRSLLSVQERQEAYDRMVRAFVKAIELKDGYTRGHAERVSDLSVRVAERMGLSYEERQLIRYGAILHDVGKIGVSLGILCKAGPLDDDEFAEMKTHPEVGAEMLRDIDFLKPALAIVHHHHERMDGRGYPAGLAGDEIPVLTRVVTAVDAFDAMTSTRSYRRALPVSVALEELQAHAGTQFDAEVVRHLVDVIVEEGWQITDEPVAVASASGGTPQMAMP